MGLLPAGGMLNAIGAFTMFWFGMYLVYILVDQFWLAIKRVALFAWHDLGFKNAVTNIRIAYRHISDRDWEALRSDLTQPIKLDNEGRQRFADITTSAYNMQLHVVATAIVVGLLYWVISYGASVYPFVAMSSIFYYYINRPAARLVATLNIFVPAQAPNMMKAGFKVFFMAKIKI